MNEGSEDFDVDYMMEKPIEFVNGNGTVCITRDLTSAFLRIYLTFN